MLLTGLLPYTQYDVYVRPECGSFTTHWSPVTTFRTLCSLLDTLPYTEDFDSYTGNPKPTELPCWQGRVGLNTLVVNLTGGAHSGSRVMRWEWSIYESVVDHKIVLPAINTAVLPINSLQLSFWAKNIENIYNRYDPARVVVGVMDDPDVDSTLQVIDTLNIVGDEWTRYDVPLTAYRGTGRYIAILSCPSTGSRNSWYAYIDDVLIDLAPPCANVTGMSVTGLTSTSVTVEWDAADSGTRWQVYIDTTATATPVADTTVLTLPSCTFSGLVSEMPYYVWVRAICPKGDTSGWEDPMQVMPGTWNMRANKNDTLTMCGVSLYDSGGATDVFSNQTSRLVILPDVPGHLVSISGLCDIGGSSTLTIYDGVGTSGSVLWTKTINNSYAVNFGPVTSSVGAVTLYFWAPFSHNDNGFELQVSCVPDTCIVHHLQLDPSVPVSDTMLALTWQCNGASHYEVEYGPVGFTLGSGTLDSTTTNYYTIGGLASLDRREVYVRSVCGEGDTGAWVQGIFTTQPCSDAVFRENFDSTFYSNSMPSMPIGFNGNPYSYVQTIIDSAHLAGLEGGITALAFHPIDNVEGDHQSGITVYLANVADTAFAAGPILPDGGHRFVKVVDSANFCHTATTDWQLLHFDRPFMWDGHKNLLVAVLRQDGGSGMRTEYAGHYRYSDFTGSINRGYVITGYSPIDIDSADVFTTPYHYGNYNCYGTHTTGDIRLYTNTCALPLCAMPVVDSITGDYENITVFWSGESNDYQLSITPGYTSLIPVSGNSYTFSGLQPATTYQVSIRQNCTADSLGFSDWTTVSFTTDSFLCPAPDSLTVVDITRNSAILDWAAAESDTLWQVEVWTPGVRHVTYSPTEHPFTIEGLMSGTEYCAYVHGWCGSAGQIAGEWSDTVCFTTPACPDVTGLDTTAVTTTSVTLVWNAVGADSSVSPQDSSVGPQDYLLEYGPAGFALGTGTGQTVTANTTTVTGLTPATPYDFYLRTRCAEDWLAGEYASLLGVTTRQPVGIDSQPGRADTGVSPYNFQLIPNPAKGVTAVQIAGLPSGMTGALHITVSDLAGREVLSRHTECNGQGQLSLKIEGLPAGAYFVRVAGVQGTAVRKLIIK